MKIEVSEELHRAWPGPGSGGICYGKEYGV